MELLLFQLPGREARFGEPPLQRLEPAAEAAAVTLAAASPSHAPAPVALFGHSLGALLAYETARRLERSATPTLVHLFVSGRRGPVEPQRLRPLHLADDEELLEAIRRLGGSPAAVLAQRELMTLLLPIVRADLVLAETYQREGNEQLTCPLTAFGGAQDPQATEPELCAWARETTGPFRLRLFPGDHFYLQQSPGQEALLAELVHLLQPHCEREHPLLTATRAHMILQEIVEARGNQTETHRFGPCAPTTISDIPEAER